MQLSPQQINELLTIIHLNQALLISEQFGLEFLSEYDKSLLELNGVDWEQLYNPLNDSIYQSFHLGMLAQAFHDAKAMNKMSYRDIYQYIKDGQYIPITLREQLVLNSIKSQSLSDIRSLNGRIFQDLNNILTNQSLESQRQFLKEEIEEGMKKKKTLRDIANTIHEKTGDWNRDFDRIVEYQCNTAYQQGRALFLEQTEGEDVEVWKRVFESACKHCLSLYTTEGYLSEPKVFRFSELKANGSNIGRKVIDWKPVIGSTHPYCFINPNTKVYTSKGYKNISEIKVDDLVLTHKGRFRKVTSLVFTERSSKEVESYFNLKFKYKDRIIEVKKVTKEHPFLINDKWAAIKDSKVGDKFSLLHDVCETENCNNKIPLYYKASIGTIGGVKYCSRSCPSSQNTTKQWITHEKKMKATTLKANRLMMSKRSSEENIKNTVNARKALREKDSSYSHLHTTEVKSKIAKTLGKRATFIELKLRYFLDQLGVDYEIDKVIKRNEKKSNGQVKHYMPDIFIPSLNIVIEADGINWHNEEYDKKRDRDIKELISADTFRFREEDIRKNPEQVFEEIRKIVHNHKGLYSFEEVELVEIEEVKYKDKYLNVRLYNFSVEEDESYIVNGIITHNCRCLLKQKRKGFTWNKETQDFDIPIKQEDRQILKKPRKGIRVKIGGEEFVV